MLWLMTSTHTAYFRSGCSLGELSDASVELVLTSPPYPMIEMWDASFAEQAPGVGKALEAGDGVTAFELMHAVLDAVWAECARVLVPGGFACINIGDATRTLGTGFQLYPNHSRVIQRCRQLGLRSLPVILWRKQTNAPNKFMGSGMLPAGAYVTLEHEYILVFRKGEKREFGEAGKARRRRSAFFWEERNEWFSDVWSFKGIRQELGNGTQRARSGAFPFELAYRLINMYSLQGDTVLDPFVGTGTTMAAGIAAARSTVGYESDPAFEPVIEQTINAAPEAGSARVFERVNAHREFVSRRTEEGKPPQHENTPHGFPVMTRQETELQLTVPTAVRKIGATTFQAAHKPLQLPPWLPGFAAQNTGGSAGRPDEQTGTGNAQLRAAATARAEGNCGQLALPIDD